MEIHSIQDEQLQIMLHENAFRHDIETTFRYYLGEEAGVNRNIRAKFLLALVEFLCDNYYTLNILEDHLITMGEAKRIAFKLLKRYEL
jgi:hypothetical protein